MPLVTRAGYDIRHTPGRLSRIAYLRGAPPGRSNRLKRIRRPAAQGTPASDAGTGLERAVPSA